MILAQNVERLFCDVNSLLDVVICKGCVHEMVVVVGEEDASLDNLGNPFLVKHKRIIIVEHKVEQRRLTGNGKVEAVV